MQQHPDGKIGMLYQNDDYGKDYVKGLKDGLGDRTAMIVAELPYETTDPTVDLQIVALKASGADVFFNVTTPKFAAQAIKKAAEIGWKPVHMLNSVSNSIGAVLRSRRASTMPRASLRRSTSRTRPTRPGRNDPGFKGWLAFMDKYYPDGDKTNSCNVDAYTIARLTGAGAATSAATI